jgi:NADPH-dependent 2,4-dienoyl-CoA reductase/sulfur reductase-like enzyme/nitrite reductase/ring-hydroxylating ferredoxin subunit
MQSSPPPTAKKTDLADGQMKRITIGQTDVLLVRVDEAFFAIGANCPHYGAPLEEGIVSDGRVICPWHQSHFCLRTGRMLEPPALDGLPSYPVRVEGDGIYVTVPDGWADRVPPPMVRADSQADGRTFAILGAGAAGVMAAQTLREAGYRGKIVLVGPGPTLPYDRPSLSKNYLGAKALDTSLHLRGLNFFRDHDIELRRDRVTKLDAATKTIEFETAQSLRYDRALIATGSRPRKPQIPGADLENVFTLRSLSDANKLLEAARPAKRAVILGASFIGMECAASLVERGLEVSIVAPEPYPFASTLGEPIGRMFQAVHEANGVVFHLGDKAKSIIGKKCVEAVELESGGALEADLVLAGLGVIPNTNFLVGVPKNDDGTVNTLGFLQVTEDLWAAGDVTTFPWMHSNTSINIAHWRLAEQHGRIAAINMAGIPTPLKIIPFFWSFQFGVGLDYVGYAHTWDEIHTDGDPSKQDFTCYYFKGDKLLAAAGCGRSQQMLALAELMRLDRTPGRADVRGETLDFIAMLYVR